MTQQTKYHLRMLQLGLAPPTYLCDEDQTLEAFNARLPNHFLMRMGRPLSDPYKHFLSRTTAEGTLKALLWEFGVGEVVAPVTNRFKVSSKYLHAHASEDSPDIASTSSELICHEKLCMPHPCVSETFESYLCPTEAERPQLRAFVQHWNSRVSGGGSAVGGKGEAPLWLHPSGLILEVGSRFESEFCANGFNDPSLQIFAFEGTAFQGKRVGVEEKGALEAYHAAKSRRATLEPSELHPPKSFTSPLEEVPVSSYPVVSIPVPPGPSINLSTNTKGTATTTAFSTGKTGKKKKQRTVKVPTGKHVTTPTRVIPAVVSSSPSPAHAHSKAASTSAPLRDDETESSDAEYDSTEEEAEEKEEGEEEDGDDESMDVQGEISYPNNIPIPFDDEEDEEFQKAIEESKKVQ